MWDIEPEIMDLTSSHKFRESTEVNHWLIREWNLATGNSLNRNINFGKAFFIGQNAYDKNGKKLLEYITKQKGKSVCINDGDLTGDSYEQFIKEIIDAFEKIVPEKSSFEK